MIHSFLLIGQSNMAGRGFLDEAIPVDNTNIKMLRNGRWVKMFRPINPDRVTSGVNLAESFAERYAQKYGVEVGLICCADGGTQLNQWKKGEILYDNAVFHTELAKRSSSLVGILWHQGEGDCSEELYPVYEEKLLQFIKDFRKDTNSENIPFVVGGLGDFLVKRDENDNLKNYKKINEALKNAVEKTERTAFVSAEGLGSNPDNLHFSAEALHEFGVRYFEEYEKIPREEETRAPENVDSERSWMEEL